MSHRWVACPPLTSSTIQLALAQTISRKFIVIKRLGEQRRYYRSRMKTWNNQGREQYPLPFLRKRSPREFYFDNLNFDRTRSSRGYHRGKLFFICLQSDSSRSFVNSCSLENWNFFTSFRELRVSWEILLDFPVCRIRDLQSNREWS